VLRKSPETSHGRDVDVCLVDCPSSALVGQIGADIRGESGVFGITRPGSSGILLLLRPLRLAFTHNLGKSSKSRETGGVVGR